LSAGSKPVGRRKMSCAGWREVAVKVAPVLRVERRCRRARIAAARPANRTEVPTVIHGMRCPARLAAEQRVVNSLAVDGGVARRW
jgi:hypothetical protein